MKKGGHERTEIQTIAQRLLGDEATESLARCLIGVCAVIEKARVMNLDLGDLGAVMIDQGSQLMVEARGQKIAAANLAHTLQGVEAGQREPATRARH